MNFKKIKFEELDVECYDVYSAIKYIKEYNNKNNNECYIFYSTNLKLMHELKDKLVDERINFNMLYKNVFSKIEPGNLIFYINCSEIKDIDKLIAHRDFPYQKLENIVIRYLFGNIKYELNIDSNLNVIHAPNGYGKSTLLNCLKYFYQQDFNRLLTIPCHKFGIKLRDIGSYGIDGSEVEYSFINENDKHYIYCYMNYYGVEEKAYFHQITSFENTEFSHRRTDEYIKYIHNYDEQRFKELRPTAHVTFNHQNQLSRESELQEKIKFFNEIIKDFFGHEKNIYLKNEFTKEDKYEYFYVKDSIVITNNIEPLKNVDVIYKKGDKIDFDKLSSGEKYICYILLTLLFDNTLFEDYNLVIIDEPELYLHVEWQQLLVENILKIIEINKEHLDFVGDKSVRFIVSTHSPYFINHPNVKVGNPEYEME